MTYRDSKTLVEARNAFYTFDDLNETQRNAVDVAEAALRHSHRRDSNLSVGAALVSINREIIAGTKCENAAYGSTICAERAAVLCANSMGIRNFNRIAIIARGGSSELTDLSALCGSRRHVPYEAAELPDVILPNSQEAEHSHHINSRAAAIGVRPMALKVDILKYQE